MSPIRSPSSWPSIVSSGVVTSRVRTRASASASYPSSQDSSRTTSRNFLGSVFSSRRMPSLWSTAGWVETWKVGGSMGASEEIDRPCTRRRRVASAS